jgi:hypothetical protein
MNAHEERMAALAKAELETYSRERLLEFCLLQRLSLRECQKELRRLMRSQASDTPASGQSPQNAPVPRSK